MSSTHHTNPSVNTIANEALGYISETTAICPWRFGKLPVASSVESAQVQALMGITSGIGYRADIRRPVIRTTPTRRV